MGGREGLQLFQARAAKHVQRGGKDPHEYRGHRCWDELSAWDIADLDLRAATLKLNNLDALNNPGKPAEMRFGPVFETDDLGPVDLKLTALTPLTPGKKYQKGNGATGDFGVINIRSQSSVTIRYEFVKADTDERVTVHKFWFSVFDFDGDKGDPLFKEEVTIGGIVNYTVADPTEIAVEKDKFGVYTFTSTEPDGHGGLYNPQDALELTDEQKRRTASMYFDGVRKFDVTFAGYGGSTNKPRSFMFAGKSALNFDPDGCPLPACLMEPGTTQWDAIDLYFNVGTLTQNNLDNQGTGHGAEEIRYSQAVFVGDTKVDLVLTALSPMTPGNKYLKSTGVSGDFGTLNIETGTTLSVRYQFVVSGTYTPVTMYKLWFTVLDIDGDITDPAFKEAVTVSGASSVKASQSSEVVITNNTDGSVTLTSSQPDASGGKRNPTHALELTEEQANRAATVLFDDISEFTVEFAAIGTENAKSRSFFFAGKSSLNFEENGCPREEAP